MAPSPSRHAVANGPALGDLLSRVAAGEEAALAALYEATGRRVFGLARRLLVEPETAEQVTLEVYTQAWRLARTYDPRQGSLESWLLSLTCRRAGADAPKDANAGLRSPAAETDPPGDLKGRLLERIRGVHVAESAVTTRKPPGPLWGAWPPDARAGGEVLVRERHDGWEPTGFPGIETRRLFIDADHDRATMLVRMAPGSVYPSHRHAGPEECFVLQGDLQTGDLTLNAGDYRRVARGSLDPEQWTWHGCLLLMISSLGDEIVIEGRA